MSDPKNPQQLNRFSYVTNNPLRYTDPTGHILLENEGGGGCSTSGYCPGPGSSDNPSDDDSDYEDQNDDDILHPSEDDETDQELTDVQLIGQVITFGLIEATILLPIDIVLVEATVVAGAACLDGILPMCLVEIPIAALDVVIVDFQVSLGNTIAQNIATGTSHEFEWLIIPELISSFTE